MRDARVLPATHFHADGGAGVNAALERQKLAAVLGMLGSAHEGEILAAARQAERLRRQAGTTWGDLLVPRLPPRAEPQPTGRGVFDMANFCLDFGDTLLSEWETEFCRSVGIRAANGRRVSEKQLAVLTRIHAKCQRAPSGVDT